MAILGRLKRVPQRIELLLQGRARCYPLAASLVRGKRGLEIGGPSSIFGRWDQQLPIYRCVASLDNCVFSSNTVWEDYSKEFRFDSRKNPGQNVFCDGSNLGTLPDGQYDFILSCHNLEHLANPVKALKEWQRVSKPGAALVLVVPDHRRTFDHRRAPTSVDHMLHDYEVGTEEDDMTHVQEILEKHDLSRDPQAGSFEQFKARALQNFQNRCLHHHVFDESNIGDLLLALRINVHLVERCKPCNIFVVATFPA